MKKFEDGAKMVIIPYNSPNALWETDIFLAAAHYTVYSYYWLIDIVPVLLEYQLRQMGRDAMRLIQEILDL